MTYTDRTLTCVDCGMAFTHTAADQEYYAEKGFTSDPKRCPSCRASRRQSGATARTCGASADRAATSAAATRSDREYFAVTCSRCGNNAQVPFRPRLDKPVYCSDCFRAVKAG